MLSEEPEEPDEHEPFIHARNKRDFQQHTFHTSMPPTNEISSPPYPQQTRFPLLQTSTLRSNGFGLSLRSLLLVHLYPSSANRGARFFALPCPCPFTRSHLHDLNAVFVVKHVFQPAGGGGGFYGGALGIDIGCSRVSARRWRGRILRRCLGGRYRMMVFIYV